MAPAPDKHSPVLDILRAENEREMTALGKQKDPAYYLAYQLVEQRVVNLDAEGGALITDSDDTLRNLDVEVRVGKPASTTPARWPTTATGSTRRSPGAARRRSVTTNRRCRGALWLETDRRYREAVSALGYVRQDQSTLKSRVVAPDFSPEPPRSTSRRRSSSRSTRRSGSSGSSAARPGRCAARRPAAAAACCSSRTPRTWSTARAARSRPSWTNAQFSVSAGVKADDGMNLARLEQRFGRTPADLPPDAEVDKMIATVTGDIDALHEAPLADPYVGPAILEGRAAGVFFHEVFGHRIVGPPSEGADVGPDLRVVRRQGHRARLAVGLRRSGDRHAQRRPAQRVLPLRRRGGAGRAGSAWSTTASSSGS